MKVKLGDVIQLNPSEKLPKGERARKIAMDNLDTYAREISGFDFDEYKGGTKFRNEDTLLARITPCLENGKTAYVNILEKDEVAFGSTEYFVLRANKELINPLYLYYLSVSSDFRTVAIKSMTGTSGRQRVQKEAIFNYEFDLPSLKEQERIVSRIGCLDDKKALNDRINDNLLELAKEIYQKEIASSSLIKTTLKDIATITMGQSPNSKTYNVEGIGIELLNGAADFRNGIHPSKWTTDPKKIVQKGAYIFGVRATVGLTRKVFKKYAIGRGTGSATAKAPVNDEFLYFVLDDMFKYFSNSGSGSVYINISKSDINNYTVHMPQDSGLESFHQIVGPIMKKIHANEQECLELIKMRETLLNKFF